MTGEQSSGRSRGRPPRVSQALIVETARKMDLSTLTMQAVADELGVDRKTVHYHVADRDQLLQLIAAERFRDELARATVDTTASWPDALREFTTRVRDASLTAGALATHYTLEASDLDQIALAPAEVALRSLLNAGFDDTSASHVLRMAALLGSAFAREIETERRLGHLHQRDVVEEAIRVQGDGNLSALHHLVQSMPDVGTDAAYTFSLDLLVAGADALRSRTPATDL